MGIHYFFSWFKETFSESIKTIKSGEKVKQKIDTIMIDLNGIIHSSDQKVYCYGEYEKLVPFGKKKLSEPSEENLDHLVFKEITDKLEFLIKILDPQKRIIICIDGTAPSAKQAQQRQRRFRSTGPSVKITPGTDFMYSLGVYLEKFLSFYSLKFKGEIIFSSAKVAGEGEHKLINYLRKFGKGEETYCIIGLDADLIMLSLGTHLPKFFIFREDTYNFDSYFLINIGDVRKKLVRIMSSSESQNSDFFIHDFILICFLVGNDFLPRIPGVDIVSGGMNFLVETYKKVYSERGHLTEKLENGIFFKKKPLSLFLKLLSREIKIGENKDTFPDLLIENNTSKEGELDIKGYKRDYYLKIGKNRGINVIDVKDVCYSYLHGVQWVLNYYLQGVPDWKWLYPYHYSPFLKDLSKYTKLYSQSPYPITEPTPVYQQLLSVVSPKSVNLLPKPLMELVTSPKSPLFKYYPLEFEVDISGKRKDYEGIVLIPILNINKVDKIYQKYNEKFKLNETKQGKSEKKSKLFLKGNLSLVEI